MTSSGATSTRSERCKQLVRREDVLEHHQQITTRQTTRHHEGVGNLTERSMTERSMPVFAAGACAAWTPCVIMMLSPRAFYQNNTPNLPLLRLLGHSLHQETSLDKKEKSWSATTLANRSFRRWRVDFTVQFYAVKTVKNRTRRMTCQMSTFDLPFAWAVRMRLR